MNLINLYIDEVIRRLPDKNNDDLALELESTIYDMLPDNYSEENVKDVLTTLGHPAVLASKYSEQPMHLIGPKYYDVYISLLKMIVPIAIIISLIVTVAESVLNPFPSGAVLEMLITIFSQGIWVIVNMFIQIFFWLTLIFTIIERSDKKKDDSPVSMRFKSWTPEDLKHMKHVPKQKLIKTFEPFLSLLWTAVWVSVYFYADHLLGVYESSDNGLRMVTPAFNQEVLMFFWPFILLIIGAEVIFSIYQMIKKEWTKKVATLLAAKEVVTGLLFVIILNRANLFTSEFLQELSQLFNQSPTIIKNSIVWGVIGIMIISSGISIFDAYRKANINVRKDHNKINVSK